MILYNEDRATVLYNVISIHCILCYIMLYNVILYDFILYIVYHVMNPIK